MAGTNLGTAYVSIMPSAKGMGSALSSQMQSEGGSAGTTFGNSFASTAIKIIAASGIGLAVKKFFSDSLAAGGALQQSFGGLETIYGDAADGMKDLAYEAAKAGISANDYAEQAVSFGASLRQAFGGDTLKAADAANMAILDMADNSAKMGTEIGAIQNAYQGFAKQNYTMLDNLKLGYGGTKTEMERLLVDAEKLTGVHYDISNLGDVYSAIHAIQGELGITGVAAAEAEGTFTGSAQSMKAAWENLKADMALGNDLTEDLKIVAVSAKNYLTKNMLPMIGNIFKSIPKLLGTALKEGFKNLPNLVEIAKNFLDDLASGFDGNGGVLIEKFKELAKYAWVAFKNTDWAGLGKSILNLIAAGLKEVGSVMLDALQGIGEYIKTKFGGENANWKEVGTTILTKIGEGLGEVGKYLFDKIGSIGSYIKEKLEKTNWEETGRNVVKAIGNGFKAFGEAVKTIWESAKESFKDVDWPSVGRNIIEFIVEGLQSLGEFLWGAIKEIAQAAWDKAKEVDWIQLGKDIIKAIWEGLGAIGHWIWEKLQMLGQAAVEKLKDVDWIQLGKDIIKFIWEGLGAIGHWIWEKLQTLGETAVTKVSDIDWVRLGKDIIKFIWNGLVEIGSDIWEKLKEIGEEAVEKFKDIDWVQLGKDVIGLLWDGLEEWGHQIWEKLGEIGQKAREFFTGDDGTDDWSTAGQDIIDKITNGLYGNTYSLQSASDYMASVILTAMYGNYYDYYGIGQNIVAGIVEGMSSYMYYAQQMAYAIANVVSSAFMGVHGFMIGSPSKLMRDKVGKQISAGIAVGIDEGADMIDKAIAGVANSAVSDFNVDVSRNVSLDAVQDSRNTGGDITINVYPSAGMDERGLADMVQQRLALAQRQKQAAWGTA